VGQALLPFHSREAGAEDRQECLSHTYAEAPYLVILRRTDRWKADAVIRVSDAPDGVNGVSECAGRAGT